MIGDGAWGDSGAGGGVRGSVAVAERVLRLMGVGRVSGAGGVGGGGDVSLLLIVGGMGEGCLAVESEAHIGIGGGAGPGGSAFGGVGALAVGAGACALVVVVDAGLLEGEVEGAVPEVVEAAGHLLFVVEVLAGDVGGAWIAGAGGETLEELIGGDFEVLGDVAVTEVFAGLIGAEGVGHGFKPGGEGGGGLAHGGG